MIKVTVLTSLYNCVQYLEGYFFWISKLEHTDNIEILLLHNDPKDEEINIINKYISFYPFVKQIIIPERETLYASWNRGIKLSSGEYIAIWNVDDIRTPDSLFKQEIMLDSHPLAAITYGNCTVSLKYGNINGEEWIEPEFSRKNKEFYRNHFIGCFPMWRKSVHRVIGYFDEQFRLVADLDFQIRVVRKFDLIKTPGNMGAFLDLVPSKLSSNRFYRKNEETMLMKRYGIYDKIDLLYYISSRKMIDYRNLYYEEKKHNIEDLFKNYNSFIKERKKLWFMTIVRQPRFILAYLKHVILNIE